MAPPHSTGAPKPKPKLKKPRSSTSSAAKQPKGPMHKPAAHTVKETHRGNATKHSDGSRKGTKQEGEAKSKVDKKRQRGHRGRGKRPKAKTQTLKSGKAKNASKQGAPRANGRHALLTLPEEMRHSIFTMALKEDHQIVITKALKLPPLLSVCRQIREEGMKIWAQSNTFHITVDRFDARLLAAWNRFVTEVLGYRPITGMFVNDSHNWANLLHWARIVQEGRIDAVPATADGMPRGHTIASAAIGIAYYMQGEAWEDCKMVLERFRLALEALHGGWV